MLVFGSQMHIVTFVIVILELMMLPFVLWYYFAWPKDKTRLWYFILLVLLIAYNLAGGLLPDAGIQFISIPFQNVIAYGAGFLMASFFPYYFYSAFNLVELRFHAIYGVPLFLLLPFVVFFGVLYPLTNNLELMISYGLVIPFLYSPVLLRAIVKSVHQKFDSGRAVMDRSREQELRAVRWAVAPWVCMAGMAYLQATQWVEVLVTNTGFVVTSVLFMLRTVRAERAEKERLLEHDAGTEKQRVEFMKNCRAYQLSNRESQVSEYLCRGLTYRQIADYLYISEKTVDAHIQRIFLKTGVNKKIELQKTLGYGATPDAEGSQA